MSTSVIAGAQPGMARRPRFRRCNPPPLRLTSDDLAIIRHVGEHRFLRSTHLVDLLGRSPDKLIRRLGALYHNAFLDRPHAQIDYFARSGSAPLIYALGSKGANVYASLTGTDPPSTDWTDKNRDAKRPYLEHALLIADVMVTLERATHAHPAIKLLPARELVPHEVRAPKSWTLTATLPASNMEIAVTPDKVFGLENTRTGKRSYFLLEADRSTMPIERPSLAQSSFKKKLLVYHHAHKAKRHVALWGIPGFRVLTVTKSRERINSMLAVVNEITGGKGSNVFLFTDSATILKASDILSTDFITGKNGSTPLIS